MQKPAHHLHDPADQTLRASVSAAVMALVQTDARRFFCDLFLNHSSLGLIGLELPTPVGLTGALYV